MPARKDKITPEEIFSQRRTFIQAALLLLGAKGARGALASNSKHTDFSLVSSYNNYYEFTTNKKMVKHLVKDFETAPWTLQISGLVENPITLSLDSLKSFRSVYRVYSLRCVEGWSAMIPWQGIVLNDLLAIAKPLPTAKFVKFVGTHSPKTMIAQRRDTFPWPYVEGLRLDEAQHDLTLLATGMYGQALTKQNGAPIRLVVPWKYGYKSIKAIRAIKLTDTQPQTSWNKIAPSEYGFYGNVNPNIPHPRWSQRFEVPLGQTRKKRTQLLNGYFEETKTLYAEESLDALW